MSSCSRKSGINRYRSISRDVEKEAEIEKQIVEISQKIERANHSRQEKESHLLSKIHQHNTKDIQLHQHKANQQLNNQISSFTRKITKKIDAATNNKKRIDHFLEQRQSEK